VEKQTEETDLVEQHKNDTRDDMLGSLPHIRDLKSMGRRLSHGV